MRVSPSPWKVPRASSLSVPPSGLFAVCQETARSLEIYHRGAGLSVLEPGAGTTQCAGGFAMLSPVPPRRTLGSSARTPAGSGLVLKRGDTANIPSRLCGLSLSLQEVLGGFSRLGRRRASWWPGSSWVRIWVKTTGRRADAGALHPGHRLFTGAPRETTAVTRARRGPQLPGAPREHVCHRMSVTGSQKQRVCCLGVSEAPPG